MTRASDITDDPIAQEQSIPGSTNRHGPPPLIARITTLETECRDLRDALRFVCVDVLGLPGIPEFR